ncbi:hypothetical protein LTR37_010540 [Vermiconidia calcicola]|uniref:Uncharacterized protein n=1 Tax=Vermiconidia calcicola TaxID=1690605 RepID=A0ACC3N4U1_9PEZI|nr:hypothetical protein LTR37_010540 [Vermiconidia calcicola]
MFLLALFILASQTVTGLPYHQRSVLWNTLAGIPISPRQEHATVALEDSVYILGGVVPDPSNTSIYLTTDLVQRYNIREDTWNTLASMPIALNHVNAATVDGKLYVLGALAVASDGAWRATTEASFVYDPSEDAWDVLGSIPIEHARGSASVGVHGTSVHLAGGMRILHAVQGGEQDTVDTVSIYDTLTDTWTSAPGAAAALPEGRNHACSAVVNQTFFVIGGRTEGQVNVKDTVFTLDLEDPAAGWSTRSSRMPTARGGLACGTVENAVYTFGGEGNPANGSKGVFDQVEKYDTLADRWTELAPMPTPVHGTYAAAVSNAIYVPGGGISIGGAAISTLQVLAV